MTALLTADEAALLVPGERLVIVRAGEPMVRTDRPLWPGSNLPDVDVVAPQDWVELVGPCEQCEELGLLSSDGVRPRYRVKSHATVACGFCKGRGRRIVPLYTECPTCLGDGYTMGYGQPHRCERCCLDRHHADCDDTCQAKHIEAAIDHPGRVLAGRGSIEVVPLVDGLGAIDSPFPRIAVVHDTERNNGLYLMRAFVHPSPRFDLPDPLPVPGRDFGIVIDCVEVAT